MIEFETKNVNKQLSLSQLHFNHSVNIQILLLTFGISMFIYFLLRLIINFTVCSNKMLFYIICGIKNHIKKAAKGCASQKYRHQLTLIVDLIIKRILLKYVSTLFFLIKKSRNFLNLLTIFFNAFETFARMFFFVMATSLFTFIIVNFITECINKDFIYFTCHSNSSMHGK